MTQHPPVDQARATAARRLAALACGGDAEDPVPVHQAVVRGATVELDAPLGDRVLVDGHRAAPVPVAPSP